jgi:hypothetical protein
VLGQRRVLGDQLPGPVPCLLDGPLVAQQ